MTGSSGFVGGHVIKFLQQKPLKVFGTYHQHKPAPAKGVSYIACDFLNRDAVVKLFRKTKPTHVIHLVGQSSPSLSWKIPYETVQGNVFSTIHLLDACRKLNAKPKILYVSSAHVYGQTFYEKATISETDLPKPMDPYGASKIQGEYFVMQYYYQFKIPFVIMRSSAHIGVNQPPFFSISNFAKQIAEIEKRKKPPVILVGNLNVKRGFVAVDDMVRAYWLALLKGKSGEIYNVGAQNVKTMGEWLQDLLNLSDAEIKIQEDPARRRLKEPIRIAINSRKFRRATGWYETEPILRTFEQVLDWWRSRV